MSEPTLFRDALSIDNFQAGKNLLNELMTGKIKMAEFEKEVAYFAVSCGFDELSYKPLPTKIANMEYYLKEKNRIQNMNNSNRTWLKELLIIFERLNDTILAEKVRLRLNEFEYEAVR